MGGTTSEAFTVYIKMIAIAVMTVADVDLASFGKIENFIHFSQNMLFFTG